MLVTDFSNRRRHQHDYSVTNIIKLSPLSPIQIRAKLWWEFWKILLTKSISKKLPNKENSCIWGKGPYTGWNDTMPTKPPTFWFITLIIDSIIQQIICYRYHMSQIKNMCHKIKPKLYQNGIVKMLWILSFLKHSRPWKKFLYKAGLSICCAWILVFTTSAG